MDLHLCLTMPLHCSYNFPNFPQMKDTRECLPWRKSDVMSYMVRQNFNITFKTEVMGLHTPSVWLFRGFLPSEENSGVSSASVLKSK